MVRVGLQNWVYLMTGLNSSHVSLALSSCVYIYSQYFTLFNLLVSRVLVLPYYMCGFLLLYLVFNVCGNLIFCLYLMFSNLFLSIFSSKRNTFLFYVSVMFRVVF